MGGAGGRGAEPLSSPRREPRTLPDLLELVALLALCFLQASSGAAQAPPSMQCRIQTCTTDFVALTTRLPPAAEGLAGAFCGALRAYSACTQRTARACRGNLVFHSALLGISDLLGQRNCSREGPTAAAAATAAHPGALPQPCSYHSRAQQGHAPRPGYLFCGLFGDPHLRTFQDSFQTCKVEGAWPLIDNDYLSVQVTNVPVATGSSATATSKVTVIFKPFPGCTEQKVYQAVTDDLPAAFTDGSLGSGGAWPGGGGAWPGGRRALWILEVSAGRHVELHAGYMGVTAVVRQHGRHLALAVRIPEEMASAYDASQDLQLCLTGCPTAERLPLVPPGGGRGQGEARARCGAALRGRQDVYFHSCVFDLLTTGDANFSAAAAGARHDLEALHPHPQRWSIPPPGPAHNAAARPVTGLTLLLLLLGGALV